MRRVIAGLGASALVATGGWRASALTGRGALVATLVGTAVTVGTSWPGMLSLGTFFVSSSALSKQRRAPGIVAKGSRRDAVQVLANGGAAALAAILLRQERDVALAVSAGSLAAATADTWATEIGSFSGVTPRQLISGRTVEPGESGGVTLPGTAASAAGAMLIASVAGISAAAWSGPVSLVRVAGPVFVAGVGGSLVDSLAGELVQERRYCPTCDARTEARVHRCGSPTDHVGGVRGITNDTVNVMCTASGALLAWMICRLVRPGSRSARRRHAVTPWRAPSR